MNEGGFNEDTFNAPPTPEPAETEAPEPERLDPQTWFRSRKYLTAASEDILAVQHELATLSGSNPNAHATAARMVAVLASVLNQRALARIEAALTKP